MAPSSSRLDGTGHTPDPTCLFLDVVLRALGITRLLVAGVVTNVCVESTVRSAAQRDFDVTVASDCTAAADGFHQPALRGMEAVFASVSGWRHAAERLAS
jgi:ureidoacrylate peracid hydrolase